MAKDKSAKKTDKKKKRQVLDIPTGVVIMLFGAAAAILMVIIIWMHTPTEQSATCKDGWSFETKDGKIVKTYIPENDTCKNRGSK